MVRDPFPFLPAIEILDADAGSLLRLPFIDSIVAGFPSPADDFIELALDLNKALIDSPSSTFYGRIRGDSMRDEGIHDGDIVVIDKARQPADGCKAVCYIDGQFTIKTLRITSDDGVWLLPGNPDFQPIRIIPDNDFLVWGVVTYVIHRM